MYELPAIVWATPSFLKVLTFIDDSNELLSFGAKERRLRTVNGEDAPSGVVLT